MSISALIFDVDGTLADTEEAHRRAFNAAFREHGLDWDWNPDLYAELLQITGGKERIAHHIDSPRLTPAQAQQLKWLIPRIHRSKTRYYTESVEAGQVPLRRGVHRLISEALAARVKLAIASTTTLANVRALIVSGLGFSALARFNVIASGDVVANKKPAPDIYLYALSRLRLAPRQCVAFEDSAAGLCSAKAAGLGVVVTPTCWTGGQDFAEADLVLPSLGDASEPFQSAPRRLVGAGYLSLECLDAMHDTWNACANPADAAARSAPSHRQG